MKIRDLIESYETGSGAGWDYPDDRGEDAWDAFMEDVEKMETSLVKGLARVGWKNSGDTSHKYRGSNNEVSAILGERKKFKDEKFAVILGDTHGDGYRWYVVFSDPDGVDEEDAKPAELVADLLDRETGSYGRLEDPDWEVVKIDGTEYYKVWIEYVTEG